MKTAFCVSAAVLASWFAVQEQNSEEVAKGWVKAMHDLTEVLKTVKDKGSAEAALSKLEDATKRLLAHEAKKSQLPKQDLQKLQQNSGKDFDEAERGVKSEADRLLRQADLQVILKKSAAWAKYDTQYRIKRAKLDIRQLEAAVSVWYVKNRFYPDSLEELVKGSGVLGGPPLITADLLTDPWDRPYVYTPKVLHAVTDVPLIWSHGPAPKDESGRISNWDVKANPNKK